MPQLPTLAPEFAIPTISVLIRTRNRPRLLARALDSLAHQLRKPDEVIVINDGGRPVEDALAAFHAAFPLHYQHNPTSVGRAAAGNQAVALASGRFIAFLDDDDRFLPDHLQRLEQAVVQFDARVAYTGCKLLLRDVLGQDGAVLQETPLGVFNDPFDAQRLQYENYIPIISLLIDRALWQEVGGFDPAFELFEDWDLLARLAKNTRFFHINALTSEYGKWGSEQITGEGDAQRWRDAYRQWLDKHWMPLPDATKLAQMASYWQVSQERRGVVQAVRDDNVQLKLRLADQQQHALALQQQLYGLQQQITTVQEQRHGWEQHYHECEQRHQQAQQAAATQLRECAQQQHEREQQQQQALQAEQQRHAAFVQDSQRRAHQLHAAHAELEQTLRACQASEHHLRTVLHEIHKHLILGMTHEQLRQILLHQRPWFAHPAPDWTRHVESLLVWQQQRWQPARTALQGLDAETQSLELALHQTHTALTALSDSAMRSRILHRMGYVKLLDRVNDAMRNLARQVHQVRTYAVPLPQDIAPQQFPVPPPRAPGALYPSLTALAGTPLRVLEHAPRPPDAIAFPLSTGQALSFMLYCAEDGLCRLDFALATFQRLNHCLVRLIVRDPNQPEPPLRVVYAQALAMMDNALYPFEFTALDNSAGQMYHIELDSPDANEQHTVAIWCQPCPPLARPATEVAGTLPAWAQEALLCQEWLPVWRAEGDCTLVLHDPGAPLTLARIFAHFARGLRDAGRTARVLVWGEIPDSTRAWLATLTPTNAFTVCPAEAEVPAWLATQWAVLPPSAPVWLIAGSYLPTPDIIARAERIFAAAPDADALIPLVQGEEGRVWAAYGHIDFTGAITSQFNGLPIEHPYLGYYRPVWAAAHPLAVLRADAVAALGAALRAYTNVEYALSEAIWRSHKNHRITMYCGDLRFTAIPPAVAPAPETWHNDAARFFARWQDILAAQPWLARASRFPLNPQGKPEILIVDATLPSFDQDSGSLRIYTLMKLLMELGWSVTFFPDNLDSNPKYRAPLEALGIQVFHGSYSFGDAIINRNFAVAMVCRVDIGQRYIPFLRTVTPSTRIWYDTVDIHYVRELRQAEIENNPELAHRAQETRRKELANCILADCALVVTDDDGKHLQKELPSLQYVVLPNVHTQPPPPCNGYAQRNGLVFIGNYNHQPNEDAVFFLIKHILPRIRARLPEIKFYVIGSNMKPAMRDLRADGVEIVGWVDEVAPEFEQRRIFVSYLRYGAGMKGKLGQALSLGLPIVSTTIGAEGMELVHNQTALIADDPDQFASEVIRLYQDEALWNELSRQGREHVEARYGESAVRRILATMHA